MNHDWKTAVLRALARLMKKHPARVENECFVFTRQELIQDELPAIITETGTTAQRPSQSLTFALEELRAMRIIRPLEPERGIYAYDRNQLIEGTWVTAKRLESGGWDWPEKGV